MTPQGQKELPISEESVFSEILESQKKNNWLEFLLTLAKHKRFVFLFVTIAVITAIVVSLLLPFYYTSQAKIMPPQQGQSMGAALMGELGQLGGLLGAMGGRDLLKNPSDLYVAMLRSRTVADRLIDRFSLMKVYKTKKLDETRQVLDDNTLIIAAKEGVISVSVDDRDAQRAADLANAYIEELEKLTKSLAVTDASKRRIFFEHQAKEENDQLATAEQALKQTEEKTGVFQPDSQTRVMLEGYAELKAQVAAKEVQIQAMRSFATAQNPDVVRAEQELAALKAQVSRYEEGQGGRPIGDIALERVPAKALEYVRKFREVKYHEALLQLMLKQYEIARMDEGRDASLIQVLDPAIPAERRSRPKRTLIVLSVAFLAFLLAIVGVYVREAVARAKEDPQNIARWQLLKFYLLRGRKHSLPGD